MNHADTTIFRSKESKKCLDCLSLTITPLNVPFFKARQRLASERRKKEAELAEAKKAKEKEEAEERRRANRRKENEERRKANERAQAEERRKAEERAKAAEAKKAAESAAAAAKKAASIASAAAASQGQRQVGSLMHIYSASQKNVVKGCVIKTATHATFDQYFFSQLSKCY